MTRIQHHAQQVVVVAVSVSPQPSAACWGPQPFKLLFPLLARLLP